MSTTLPDILTMAHDFAERALEPGGVAVDATVGNGHDTLFLARQVGSDGVVHGFDVQEVALQRTRERLAAHGWGGPVTLYQAGHQALRRYVPAAVHGRVDAAMFNLGYLPGSSSDRITRPDTTLAALEATVEVLRPGGVATAVLYTGHEGGEVEAEAVDTWARESAPQRLSARSYAPLNASNDPPRLLALEKRSDASE